MTSKPILCWQQGDHRIVAKIRASSDLPDERCYVLEKRIKDAMGGESWQYVKTAFQVGRRPPHHLEKKISKEERELMNLIRDIAESNGRLKEHEAGPVGPQNGPYR